MLNNLDTIALVALSNGYDINKKDEIKDLIKVLRSFGLDVVLSRYLYKENYEKRTGIARAKELMQFYMDDKIKMIFDVSGGDLANEVLIYLDYNFIKNHYKPFFGYSDLTTVINALYSKTGKENYLYQIRNLIKTFREKQVKDFKDSLFEDKASLYDFEYVFLRKDYLKGKIVGGNIRCFLKLSATEFMPKLENKVLFLESRSGSIELIISFFNQLKQIGALEKVNGVVLGTFSQIERENNRKILEKIVLDMTLEYDYPVVTTPHIGHGDDSKCIIIGKEYEFKK